MREKVGRIRANRNNCPLRIRRSWLQIVSACCPIPPTPLYTRGAWPVRIDTRYVQTDKQQFGCMLREAEGAVSYTGSSSSLSSNNSGDSFTVFFAASIRLVNSSVSTRRMFSSVLMSFIYWRMFLGRKMSAARSTLP